MKHRDIAPGRYTVVRGCYNLPEANAEAFVDGFFRTDDLGRLDEDGYLTIVDRRKDMILSGGLNIYSKEVERVLESYPAVAEAAVVGVADARFGEAVRAYVVLNSGVSVSAAELIERLGTRNALSPSPTLPPCPPPRATIAPPAAHVQRRREGQALLRSGAPSTTRPSGRSAERGRRLNAGERQTRANVRSEGGATERPVRLL